MPTPRFISENIVSSLLKGKTGDEVLARLKPRLPKDEPLPKLLPDIRDMGEVAVKERLDLLKSKGVDTEVLHSTPKLAPKEFAGNIENFIGYSTMPLGLIGPLRINGLEAHGDFYVPLATTEGALVASYNRGAYVASQSGGVSVACTMDAVSRAPCFIFDNLGEAGSFVANVSAQFDQLQTIIDGTSRFCRLLDVRSVINGKEVYLIFDYTSGDASGQNMVTLATDAICKHLVQTAAVKPQKWFIEGNMSGDKKATMSSFMYSRGKKMVAEVVIPSKLVRRCLKTTVQDMFTYWQVSFIGASQTGAIGSQGHYANALAALFNACGQDVACVSEASVGTTRLDIVNDGDLYVSVHLPNLIIGTVGGGTRFPTAQACLKLLDCVGADKSKKLADIFAATVLAGEVSIIGALAAGDFANAHATFGRKQNGK